MNVLLITSQVTYSGGVASIIIKKANELAQLPNVNVAIASTNDSSDVPFFALHPNVSLYLIPTKMTSLLDLNALRKELNAIKHHFCPDVVSVSDNGLKSFFFKKMFKDLPVVYEIHGNETYFYKGDTKGLKQVLHQIICRTFISSFDLIVTQNSNFSLPKRLKRVKFIPNFVEKPNATYASVDFDKFIAVGRIVKSKNYEGLIRIWTRVIEKYPNKTLHIFGSAEDDALLKALTQTKGIVVHNVEKDLKKIYQGAYALLHTSLNESFPMVFLEAMSYGVPIICYDINQPQLVLNKKTGDVVALNNEEAFLGKILKWIESPSKRELYATNALQHVETFSKKNIINQWWDVYTTLSK